MKGAGDLVPNCGPLTRALGAIDGYLDGSLSHEDLQARLTSEGTLFERSPGPAEQRVRDTAEDLELLAHTVSERDRPNRTAALLLPLRSAIAEQLAAGDREHQAP